MDGCVGNGGYGNTLLFLFLLKVIGSRSRIGGVVLG